MIDQLELYFIENGMSTFHYPLNLSNNDTVQSASSLSSGLLAALQSFTLETRSSNIEHFSSEKEYFLFESFPQDGFQLVGIFPNSVDKRIARNVINRIKSMMAKSELMNKFPGQHLSTAKERSLAKRIEEIAGSTISVDTQITIAKDVLNEAEDTTHVILFDIKKKTLISNLSTGDENPLLAINPKTIKQLDQTMKKMIRKLIQARDYEMISFEIENSLLVWFKTGNQIIIAMAEDIEFWEDTGSIYSIALSIAGFPNYFSYQQDFNYLDSVSRFRLDSYGHFSHTHGITPPYESSGMIDKFNKIANTINQSLDLDEFQIATVFVSIPEPHKIRINKLFTTEEYLLEIFR